MGKREKKKNGNLSIPDSAMVMPGSSDATERTREQGTATPQPQKSSTRKKKS